LPAGGEGKCQARTHLFLTAYGTWLDPGTCELATSEKVTSWAAIIAVPTFITGF
jgi:hypothetical protein